MKSSQETIELTTCASERTDRGHNGEPSGLNWLEQCACSIVKAGRIPQHVAFIMDGNRRFAREHGMEVANGHKMGYEKLEQVRAVTVTLLCIKCAQTRYASLGAVTMTAPCARRPLRC